MLRQAMIYLDHNATTPLDPEVFEAMRPFFLKRWGNPSSTYRFGAENKAALETARAAVATLLNAPSPRDILFTAGATEANNAALHAALRARPEKRHVITSAVEHSAVLAPCRDLERRGQGYRVTYLPVDREGLLSLADLENALAEHGDDTAVVSLMWASNETGVLFPVARIAELCRARGVPFHCDAVQAVGKLPAVDVRRVPVDYLALSAHKFHGPKGVGALYVRRGAPPWTPLLHGGHQERGRRGGTENVPLIVGLGHAAERARRRLPDYERTVRPLRDALEAGILGTIPGTERNGHPSERLPNTTNLSFAGIESEALLLLLDQEGLCASSGSACLADSPDPSHVLAAMKPDGDTARQSVRFSLDPARTRPGKLPPRWRPCTVASHRCGATGKMKLPADAIITREKVSEYLLRHRDEDDKSAFLALAGFTPENPARLLAAIREQLLPLDPEPLGPFAYGTKFRVRSVLRGPNGRELRVVSIWATVQASGQTRFLTLYPDKP